MKKGLHLLSLLLVFVLVICTNAGVSFAEETSDIVIEKAHEILLQSGWSEDEIECLFSEEMLLQYGDINQIVDTEERYYKVTENGVEELSEEECIKQVKIVELLQSMESDVIRPRKAILSTIPIFDSETKYQNTSDGYLRYRITIYRGEIYKYLITVGYTWLITPVTRETDILGMTTNDFLTVLSTGLYFSHSADLYKGNTWISSYNTFAPTAWINSSNGVAVKFKLKANYFDSGDLIQAKNHSGIVQAWANVNVLGSSATAKVIADYYHQKIVIAPSITVGFNSVGISIMPSVYHDHMVQNPSIEFQVY